MRKGQTDRGITQGVLESVRLSAEAARGQLPSRNGSEPDYVKGARSTLAQVISLIEAEQAHLSRQEG